ncbi:MAG: FHA domain-containing protein, partial [Gammaproteobacteria bacterium]
LMVAHGDEEATEFPIVQGRLILGRTEDNDLQIESKFVSRHHAQILTYNQDSILQDLNSTNGIYMKGQRIKKRRLKDGDLFVIGEHELLYVRDADGEKSETKTTEAADSEEAEAQ